MSTTSPFEVSFPLLTPSSGHWASKHNWSPILYLTLLQNHRIKEKKILEWNYKSREHKQLIQQPGQQWSQGSRSACRNSWEIQGQSGGWVTLPSAPMETTSPPPVSTPHPTQTAPRCGAVQMERYLIHIHTRPPRDRLSMSHNLIEGRQSSLKLVTQRIAACNSSGWSCAGSGKSWMSCSFCLSLPAGSPLGSWRSSRGSALPARGTGGPWRACRSRGCSSCWGWPEA